MSNIIADFNNAIRPGAETLRDCLARCGSAGLKVKAPPGRISQPVDRATNQITSAKFVMPAAQAAAAQAIIAATRGVISPVIGPFQDPCNTLKLTAVTQATGALDLLFYGADASSAPTTALLSGNIRDASSLPFENPDPATFTYTGFTMAPGTLAIGDITLTGEFVATGRQTSLVIANLAPIVVPATDPDGSSSVGFGQFWVDENGYVYPAAFPNFYTDPSNMNYDASQGGYLQGIASGRL